jgi:hypothetical protein
MILIALVSRFKIVIAKPRLFMHLVHQVSDWC